jgi:hypothetical protein
MPAPTMKFDEEMEVLPPDRGLAVSKETEIQVFGALITAQRVAVPRDEKKIMMRLREKAAINGDRYFYSWEAKQKKGGKGLIEGPTIKAANLVARLFGNCAVDVRSMPYDATHDITYARFADIETGFSTVRAFKQRRNQDMGMSDKERAEDIAFQIGQSKAIRNVISNALDDFCQELVDQAKTALVDWLTNDTKNVEKAWNKIGAIQEQHGITDKQIEDLIGRPNSEWLPRHLAKVLVAMRSIENGDATVKDIFGDAPTIKTDEKKPEGGKEGDGNSGQPATDSGAGGKRQPAKRNTTKAGGDDSNGAGKVAQAAGQQAAQQAQAPVQDAAAKTSAPAAEQSQAGNAQPAEQTAAPDGASTSKTIAQGAPGDNLSGAPTQQKQEPKQPPAPPEDEQGSWFTNEE